MTRFGAVALSFFAALLMTLLPAAPAAAQDVVTVGSVTVSGSVADVPVSIRDTPGTPLGMDRPAGSRIQGLSIAVTYAPASAVSSVSFSRAGITATLKPAFEATPASGNSITLISSLPVIPFNQATAGSGDLVANLHFELAPSATPGTTITVSLDPAGTLLDDGSGTAATKETATNGALALVNGSIQIAPLTITISPTTRNITSGASASYTITASGIVGAATTVSLSSSNPNVASVPASVVIAAGTKTTTFSAVGSAEGSSTITASLSAGDGGASATAVVNVAPPPNGCITPAAPSLTAPGHAVVGTSYTVSWAAVNNATEYVLEEATDAAFTDATSSTITGTSATFTHDVAGLRYYYRVRARNRATGCDLTSASSSTAAVLIDAVAAPPRRIIAVVGSTPGNFGSYFKTAVQLYNPTSSTISGRIVLQPGEHSLAYSLAPGKTVAYDDLLPAMGVPTGLGSADLIPDGDSPFPIATVRIFNDAGAKGTSGFAGEPLPADDAIGAGTTAALLAPADMQRFRLNVGIRTLDATTMTIIVRDRDGVVVKTVEKSYAANSFVQPTASALVDNYVLQGGESLSFTVTAGSAFIYGATTDNVTNDPSQLFAHKVE